MTVSINWEASLVLGLLFGLPAILIGLSRIRRAGRILNASDQKPRLSAALTQLSLAPKAGGEFSTAGSEQPASATEETTHRFETPEEQA